MGATFVETKKVFVLWKHGVYLFWVRQWPMPAVRTQARQIHHCRCRAAPSGRQG